MWIFPLYPVLEVQPNNNCTVRVSKIVAVQECVKTWNGKLMRWQLTVKNQCGIPLTHAHKLLLRANIKSVRFSLTWVLFMSWILPFIAPLTIHVDEYCLHMSQVPHQATAYPSFYSIKWLRVFLLPPGWILVHCRVTPSIKFTGTHLYTCVERGTVRVKCLAQEYDEMSPARAETRTA